MKIALILDNINSAEDIILANRHNDGGIEYLYELRLDLDKSLLNLLNSDLLPLDRIILTYRSITEGGKGLDDKEFIHNLLNYEVGYIDLELTRDGLVIHDLLKDQSKVKSSNIIISKHDYDDSMVENYRNYLDETELRLGNLEITDRSTKLNIIRKYVGKPIDSLQMLEALELKPKNSILLGIGDNGVLSRTMAKIFDQHLVFAASNKRMSDQLKIMDFESLKRSNSDDALKFGLIGKRLDYSFSPILHHLFLDSTKLNGYYHRFEIQNEERAQIFIDRLKNLDIAGLNVTNPYKSVLLNKMDKLSDNVSAVQALNTIEFSNGELVGHNTDTTGFTVFWKSLDLPNDMKINIIGAGGASIALVYAFICMNYDVTVYNRTINRFATWPNEILSQVEYSDYSILKKDNQEKSSDGSVCLINATPMNYDELKLIVSKFEKIDTGIDLNYSIDDTAFVKIMKESGSRTYDGKQMLFHQAADAFEIWTKTKLDRENLWELFEKNIEKDLSNKLQRSL